MVDFGGQVDDFSAALDLCESLVLRNRVLEGENKALSINLASALREKDLILEGHMGRAVG